MSHALRRSLNVLFALLLFPAGSLPLWSGIGRPVAEISRQSGFSPETPAGYAFSIWGVIFSLTLVYAVRQALPSQSNNPLYQRIGWATAASALFNTLWMVLAQTIGNGWWLVLIIFAIWIAALHALFETVAKARELDTFDRWVVMPMTGLLAAWLSAAVWLNLSSWLKLIAPMHLDIGKGPFALVVLALAAATWLIVLARTRGNIWYAGTALWALAGIVIANVHGPEGVMAVAIAAVCVALLVFGTTFAAARRG